MKVHWWFICVLLTLMSITTCCGGTFVPGIPWEGIWPALAWSAIFVLGAIYAASKALNTRKVKDPF